MSKMTIPKSWKVLNRCPVGNGLPSLNHSTFKLGSSTGVNFASKWQLCPSATSNCLLKLDTNLGGPISLAVAGATSPLSERY